MNKTSAPPIGIDNYGLLPLALSPFGVLDWAESNGAAGVQFSGLTESELDTLGRSGLKDLADAAAGRGLYLEWGGGQHIPCDMETWALRDIAPVNRRAAEQAAVLGVRVVRSCSGGLMRWFPENPLTDVLLQETAATLRAQRSMFEDHGVVLAIETHFEFTTHELVRLFEMCDAGPGGYLGICLDTMNLLTMLEDPLAAVDRILPWVVSTHIKDGAVVLASDGLTSFPAEIGNGVVDIPAIVERLNTLDPPVKLSIEDHGGSFSLPVFDDRFLKEFPDLTLEEFVRLVRLARRAQEKVERGELTLTDRKDWPSLCEDRIRRDIRKLKALLSPS